MFYLDDPSNGYRMPASEPRSPLLDAAARVKTEHRVNAIDIHREI
jgi:hypothetical protein